MFQDERPDHESDVDDPGAEAEDVEFGVTTGAELVDQLPGESEVPREVRRTFWSLVVLLKIAILGVSFGIMLAYFWGWATVGGFLVFLGLFASVHAYVRVRRYQRS